MNRYTLCSSKSTDVALTEYFKYFEYFSSYQLSLLLYSSHDLSRDLELKFFLFFPLV